MGSIMFMLLAASSCLLIPAVFYATMFSKEKALTLSAVLLGVAVISGILYLMFGLSVRCPLCHGPVLGRPGCSRSQKGSRLFGSYRLGVATKVVMLGHFRCPCCGEPCKCQTPVR